jgi:hypothetical protein
MVGVGAAGPTGAGPLGRQRRVGHAVDDAQLREAGEWLQALSPQAILERGLGDHGHAPLDEQPKHVEEERKRPLRQRVAGRSLELAAMRVNHPFLDLVAAHGGAADRLGETVSERRLAGARRTADDDEGGLRGRVG